MNQLVERIKLIDEQIKQIKRIIEDGNFLGAGLEISLSVGPRSQYEELSPKADRNILDGIQIGIPSDPQAVLNLLLDGLRASRKFNHSQLVREVEMARLFIDTTPFP